MPRHDSPFLLDNPTRYTQWRARKLADYPRTADALRVQVADPRAPTDAEIAALIRICAKTNMAIYTTPLAGLADKALARTLGAALGLTHLTANLLADDDGITSLTVMPNKSGRGYIPYSNQRLLWHTDGYYNPPAQQIKAFLMHCVAPAASGGENALLDHEMIYLQMRDADPNYIRALMAPDALTIPENAEAAGEVRAASVGPVFSVDAHGNLHMRYTARTRSIVWKQDSITLAAVRYLDDMLNTDSPFLFRYRLAAGEGLVCNNVLHNRAAFSDSTRGAPRLMYRARYYDRIRNTDVSGTTPTHN